MSCSSCSTPNPETGVPAGCKNNGSCGTSGCDKLEVFDWLSNMLPPNPQESFPWVEVRFKSTRKEFFLNETGEKLLTGDVVAVEGNPGHDIGTVTLTGALVRVQMRKLHSDAGLQGKKVFRKARENDLKKWQEAMAKEEDYRHHARKIAKDLGLEMKISDVECQGDGAKATFFYTADGRVDFRELIKFLARDLRVKIEMRQIGYRQEAARLGGIGVCGRELCCSTWLRDFRTVSTSAARYQQLSINPQKLAGQCGKLKCCLNYELDTYLDALKDFPKHPPRLKTAQGDAFPQKTDIFRRILYYSLDNAPETLIPLSLETVQNIVQMNKAGQFPEEIGALKVVLASEEEKAEPSFSNVIEEDSLTRFDQKKRPNKRRPDRKPSAQGAPGPEAPRKPAIANAGPPQKDAQGPKPRFQNRRNHDRKPKEQ